MTVFERTRPPASVVGTHPCEKCGKEPGSPFTVLYGHSKSEVVAVTSRSTKTRVTWVREGEMNGWIGERCIVSAQRMERAMLFVFAGVLALATFLGVYFIIISSWGWLLLAAPAALILLGALNAIRENYRTSATMKRFGTGGRLAVQVHKRELAAQGFPAAWTREQWDKGPTHA